MAKTFDEWVDYYRAMTAGEIEQINISAISKLQKAALNKILLENKMYLEENGISIIEDPPRWCETFLRNPDHPDRNLALFDYQKLAMRFRKKGKKAVLRWSRRSGKTIALAGSSIHRAVTQPNQTIVIAAGRVPHIANIFEKIRKLIGKDTEIEKGIVAAHVNPYYEIVFSNGSSIRGFVAGVGADTKRSKDKTREGSMVRGQSATLLIVDESDLIPRDALTRAVMPIAQTIDPVTGQAADVIVASTPTGKRELFFELCTQAYRKITLKKRTREVIERTNDNILNNGWTEYYIPCELIPHWKTIEYCQENGIPLSESHEFNARQESKTEDAYKKEFLADFGEEMVSVFQNKYLDDPFITMQYPINIGKQGTNNRYVIGFDSNGPKIGGHIVVVEYINDAMNPNSGRFRVVHREVISADKLNQMELAKRLVDLDRMYGGDTFVYGDAGFGTTVKEFLEHWSYSPNPDIGPTDLFKRTVFVSFQKQVEIINRVTGETSMEYIKPYIVNHTASLLETGKLILPASENTRDGLIDLMRNFYKESVSDGGVPRYTEQDDHTVIALCLAVYGFIEKYSEMLVAMNKTAKPITAEHWVDSVIGKVPGASRLMPETIQTRPGMSRNMERLVSEVGASEVITYTNEKDFNRETKNDRLMAVRARGFGRVTRGNVRFGERSEW